MPDEAAVSWRPATKSDRQLLESFQCAADDGPAFEREVQSWIRRDAITESNRGFKVDQRLLLVFDGAELVAVGCHARWANGQGEVGRLLVVGAVRRDMQGKDLSDGDAASNALMDVMMNDIADRDDPLPPWVAAKVNKANVRSLKLCDRYKLTSEQELDPELVLRVGPLTQK